MKKEKNKPAEDYGRKPQPVEIRRDLQDGTKGKDLSYLNEMPQMGRDEGVKAGVPPPKENDKKVKSSDERKKA